MESVEPEVPGIGAKPMFSRPLVSVILPIHNHARFVSAAIKSVLDQTYRPIEFLIIDDGSTDGSATIGAELLRTRSPGDGIEVNFSARENRGASETINEGIQQAKGEYIAILNSDDLYSPSRLDECLGLLARENARLLFTYVQPIDDTGAELPYDHPWRQWYYDLLMQELDIAPSISFLLLLTKNIGVSTGNFVFHRSVLSEIGLFAPYRYAHDLDFLLRYSLIEEPIILRKALYCYRVHGSNTIYENQDRVDDEIVSIVKKYLISCLSGECRNPLAPSFQNWPASLNDALHQGATALGKAVDSLLDEALPRDSADRTEHRSSISGGPLLGREITVVSHELSRTGAPMLVLALTRSLRDLGVSVVVISMSDGPLREDFASYGIPVRTLDDSGLARWLTGLGRLFHRIQRVPGVLQRTFPAWSKLIPRVPSRLTRLFVRTGDFFIWLASALTMPKLAAAIRGTLVINSFASFPLAFQLLSRWNGTTFWYIHETYDPQILLRSGAARKRFDELYKSKRIRLLFGSEATRATWAQYGFDGLVRYWSGLSTSDMRSREESGRSSHTRRTVLSVGTSGTRKGTRWLLEAFALARHRGWIPQDVQLIIVGCPAPSVYAQARDFLVRIWQDDLRGAVRLVPSVSPLVLEQYYRTADLYVQSSIMECLPLTLLSAMAHGLPVVTTDVDGCTEAIQHGENGIVVPARRIEPLASAIAELLKDDDKARSLGRKAGESFIELFSLEATIGPLTTTLMDGYGGRAAYSKSDERTNGPAIGRLR